MSIVNDLEWRYACKKFDPTRLIPEDQFEILLNALRLTPSSYGIQPWRFVVVKNKDLRHQLVEAAYNQKQVEDASHLIVLCRPDPLDATIIDEYIEDMCKTRGQEKDSLTKFRDMILKVVEKPDEQKTAWAKNQIYIALGNIMTVCATMKIDCCPMEGFSPAKFDKILELDKMNLKSVLVCPVGYRAADDKYINVKKVRYPLNHIVKTIE